jgi:collagenase-like PrtC family protease
MPTYTLSFWAKSSGQWKQYHRPTTQAEVDALKANDPGSAEHLRELEKAIRATTSDPVERFFGVTVEATRLKHREILAAHGNKRFIESAICGAMIGASIAWIVFMIVN